MTALIRMGRGVRAAVRGRPGVFVGVGLLVLALDLLVPPLVLSVARKPVDYFTFNPWLSRLPDYLVSDRSPIGLKLEKLWGLALFWFSADSPYGVEWGFAVTVADLARFAVMAGILGAYFALWLHPRDRAAQAPGWGVRAGAPGGVFGVVSSVFGLSTGGCTVMGCGAPVLPVVGLAFVGLSSTTLKWMAEASTIATWVVLLAMSAGVLYLAWRAGAPDGAHARVVSEERSMRVLTAEPPKREEMT
jgi:hypothetical protein